MREPGQDGQLIGGAGRTMINHPKTRNLYSFLGVSLVSLWTKR